MEKLVRDKIPDLMRADGVVPCVRYAAPQERLHWLFLKLGEESRELRQDPCIGECADVYEVLASIAGDLGFSIERVAEAARVKRQERGGFGDGCILKL